MYKLMLVTLHDGTEILINNDHVISMAPSQIDFTEIKISNGDKLLVKENFKDIKSRHKAASISASMPRT